MIMQNEHDTGFLSFRAFADALVMWHLFEPYNQARDEIHYVVYKKI